MTTIAKNFNTNLNFWELNPTFLTRRIFREYYEKDKSKKKNDSSRIMWAIALLLDPNEANIWKNVAENDKKDLIKDEYLEDKKFKWELVEDLCKEYEEHCLTIAEKELVRFERKLVDRGDFINKTKYTLDTFDPESGKILKGTAEQLDKMMLNTSKLNEQYKELRDNLKQEASQGSLRAGAKKSASEKGDI